MTRKSSQAKSKNGYLFRISKIAFSFFRKSLQNIWAVMFVPLTKRIQNKLASMEEYLSKAENSLVIETEVAKIIEHTRNRGIETYEKEVAQLFEGIQRNVKLTCEKKEFEKTCLSLEFDISLYELMCLKLADRAMGSNVNQVNIFSVIDEKNVTNTVEFDLKVSGEKWSQLFSKNIASEIFTRIEFYRGEVKNYHVSDLVKKTEKFIFTFSHQRLDLFMDNVMEETTSNKTRMIYVNKGPDV